MHDHEIHTDLGYWIQHDRVRDALRDQSVLAVPRGEHLPLNLVCFGADGNIVWGEEFLHAIIESGTTQQVIVVRGLELLPVDGVVGL